MNFRIIYPEDRVIGNNTIGSWYKDAVSNGEIDLERFERGETNPRLQALALEDAGLITLGDSDRLRNSGD